MGMRSPPSFRGVNDSDGEQESDSTKIFAGVLLLACVFHFSFRVMSISTPFPFDKIRADVKNLLALSNDPLEQEQQLYQTIVDSMKQRDIVEGSGLFPDSPEPPAEGVSAQIRRNVAIYRLKQRLIRQQTEAGQRVTWMKAAQDLFGVLKRIPDATLSTYATCGEILCRLIERFETFPTSDNQC